MSLSHYRVPRRLTKIESRPPGPALRVYPPATALGSRSRVALSSGRAGVHYTKPNLANNLKTTKSVTHVLRIKCYPSPRLFRW